LTKRLVPDCKPSARATQDAGVSLRQRRDPSAPPLTAIAKAFRPTEMSDAAYAAALRKRRRVKRLRAQRYRPK
jgi:hypothetical protein